MSVPEGAMILGQGFVPLVPWGRGLGRRRRIKLRLRHRHGGGEGWKEREELTRQKMQPQVALTPKSWNHSWHSVT